ncbi:protein of unknown function [Methylococcus capsulatus]|uniref:Uncharacterized protein n=1 Tax=Methylococcus capsulatus TaxID=414 RepID=A0AA35USP3_METCP|nr:protein of unknown function [Methylococcus capsulatus]
MPRAVGPRSLRSDDFYLNPAARAADTYVAESSEPDTIHSRMGETIRSADRLATGPRRFRPLARPGRTDLRGHRHGVEPTRDPPDRLPRRGPRTAYR